jgi:hypothetical protein
MKRSSLDPKIEGFTILPPGTADGGKHGKLRCNLCLVGRKENGNDSCVEWIVCVDLFLIG